MVGDESDGNAFAGRDHQPRLLVRGAAPLADRAGAGPEDVDRGQAPVCGAWGIRVSKISKIPIRANFAKFCKFLQNFQKSAKNLQNFAEFFAEFYRNA